MRKSSNGSGGTSVVVARGVGTVVAVGVTVAACCCEALDDPDATGVVFDAFNAAFVLLLFFLLFLLRRPLRFFLPMMIDEYET